MKTIKLAATWSHHTPATTTVYPAGSYQVTDEIHAAAVKAGVHEEEEANGDGTATTGQARTARKA